MPGWFSRRKAKNTFLGGIGGGLAGAGLGAFLGFFGPQLLIIAACMTAVTGALCGFCGISDTVVKTGLIVGGILGVIAAFVVSLAAPYVVGPLMVVGAALGAKIGVTVGAFACAIAGHKLSGKSDAISERPSVEKESDKHKHEQQKKAKSQKKSGKELQQTERQDDRVRQRVRHEKKERADSRSDSYVELTDLQEPQDPVLGQHQHPDPTMQALPASAPTPIVTAPAATVTPSPLPIRTGSSEIHSAGPDEKRPVMVRGRSLDIQFHSKENIRNIAAVPEIKSQGWEPHVLHAGAPVVFKKKDAEKKGTESSFTVHPDKIITNDAKQETYEAMLRAYAALNPRAPIPVIKTVQAHRDAWVQAFKAVHPSIDPNPSIRTRDGVKAQPASPGSSPPRCTS